MQIGLYSIIGVMALLIYVVINYDVFKHPDNSSRGRNYRRFLYGVLGYFAIDAMWGFIAELHSPTLLYIDSALYCIAVATTVLLWCQYVITYLRIHNNFGKFLKVAGFLFIVVAVVFLTSNHFYHNFFWIDENGGYHTDFLRYASIIAQITLFSLTSIQSLYAMSNSQGQARRRHGAILLFSIVMITAVILQFLHPLLPFYTVGLIIGNCILHVFIQEDEKDEIRKKLQENTRVISAAGYGIWKFIFDDKGNVCGLIGNEKWDEIFGLNGTKMTPEEKFNYYNERLSKSSQELVKDDYDRMRDGEVKTRIFQWNHPKKGLIYLSAGGTKLVDLDGSIAISGYIGDATEHIKNQEALNRSLDKARRDAEAANQAKSRFLFNMSHDIRTPMNAIIGFTNLLSKQNSSPEKNAEYVRKIQNSSKFLLSLINNVLEVARIESGKLTLEESVNNTHSFVQEFKSVFEEQMKQKDIDFTINVDVKHPDIYSDALKVREIYLNLLSNAFKYTNPGGKVTYSITERPSNKDGYCTYVGIVSDTGIGISKEFLPRIFDEFTREQTYTDNKIEGTGLGMPIVKKYIDLMGGAIEIKSELNKGTTITIVTSHRIAESNEGFQQAADSSKGGSFNNRQILLAEDNQLNAEIATEILHDLGIKVEVAEDGIQCLKILNEKPAHYFDLILMDIQMPNMDGFETTTKIRQMEDEDKAGIPIIAMTANAFEEDKRSAIEAGMNGHLAKPIDIGALSSELKKYI